VPPGRARSAGDDQRKRDVAASEAKEVKVYAAKPATMIGMAMTGRVTARLLRNELAMPPYRAWR
jgi:hypothetical protein